MDVKVCDLCEDPEKEAQEVSLNIDDRIDPAGDLEQIIETLDLCSDCYAAITKFLLNDLTNELPNVSKKDLNTRFLKKFVTLKKRKIQTGVK